MGGLTERPMEKPSSSEPLAGERTQIFAVLRKGSPRQLTDDPLT